MVAIIDDREDVWSRCPNLIHVKPYVFFAGTADINAPPARPSTTSTSTTAIAKPPDGVPFKVRHMTSSRNNNMKPSVAMATHHPQASKEPSTRAEKSKLHEIVTEGDVPAMTEQDTSQSTADMREMDTHDCHSNNGTTPEMHEEGDKKRSTTSPPKTDPDHDTNVHCERQEMKSDVPADHAADHAPVEIRGNCEMDFVTESNSNTNNNNGNGDDPGDKKEEGSSSSSDNSSSSGEEDEEMNGAEQEREQKSRNERESSSSSSSSSSSGIDDNLFDSLDDDPDRDDSGRATATVTAEAVDTSSKVEGAYMVAGTEKLVEEPAEGMEISVMEQDTSAQSQEEVMEKAKGLTAISASGEHKARVLAHI